ncbi:uncharacterized protein [Nicotiana tomentosiformis]|uniref:uncharacterized protein n=1 Tax=Nicotiana tomentosiformis TaxID=4098 RepID=UPI00388CE215
MDLFPLCIFPPSRRLSSHRIFPSVSSLHIQLNNLELAVNLAKNENLPGAENLMKCAWSRDFETENSPEFKKKSEQGRAARLSNKGGSVHTGGSISMAAHRRRLEKAKGRSVTHDEVFEETHMKKLKDGTKMTWIEPRDETTHIISNESWRSSFKASLLMIKVGQSNQPKRRS